MFSRNTHRTIGRSRPIVTREPQQVPPGHGQPPLPSQPFQHGGGHVSCARPSTAPYDQSNREPLSQQTSEKQSGKSLKERLRQDTAGGRIWEAPSPRLKKQRPAGPQKESGTPNRPSLITRHSAYRQTATRQTDASNARRWARQRDSAQERSEPTGMAGGENNPVAQRSHGENTLPTPLFCP